MTRLFTALPGAGDSTAAPARASVRLAVGYAVVVAVGGKWLRSTGRHRLDGTPSGGLDDVGSGPGGTATPGPAAPPGASGGHLASRSDHAGWRVSALDVDLAALPNGETRKRRQDDARGLEGRSTRPDRAAQNQAALPCGCVMTRVCREVIAAP
jgi:hypothetical protein